jgi:hypothetical protein
MPPSAMALAQFETFERHFFQINRTTLAIAFRADAVSG